MRNVEKLNIISCVRKEKCSGPNWQTKKVHDMTFPARLILALQYIVVIRGFGMSPNNKSLDGNRKRNKTD